MKMIELPECNCVVMDIVINEERIKKWKKWIKEDAIIQDVCNRIPHRDEAFGFIYYDISENGAERVELAIDRAIDLAIKKTLRELGLKVVSDVGDTLERSRNDGTSRM